MYIESIDVRGSSGSGPKPESVREAMIRAFAESPAERVLLRWQLDGVVAVQNAGRELFEYREDGHINRIFDSIVYTTEPFENPTGTYYEQQEAWEPVITPKGVRNFRVRGLL